jgi:hypothetical protein
MTSRIVRVGLRGHVPTLQVITTTYETQEDGSLREHVTMETPKELTDTAKLRLLQVNEQGKEWPSGSKT